MPNLPISQLPSANTLTGPELFVTVQDGITKQTTFNDINATFNAYTSSVQSYYLSAYHTQSIFLTSSAYTVYTMSYSNTDFAYGISISGSDKSKIKIDHPGVYDIQFSAQIDKTNSSNHKLYIWLAKNSTNVSQSSTAVAVFGGSNEESVAAWNFYVSASANDYYQLLMATDDSNILLQADPSPSAGIPAIPSIILTVGRIA